MDWLLVLRTQQVPCFQDIPHPGILSSTINAGGRGWGDCQVIFDKLEVAIGQRTETFLAAFLSCWLCKFILAVRDASCICPGTFSVASFMASGVGYCLPMAILMSIYNGLNEISHSVHLVEVGAIFLSISFMLAKNFDAYKLAVEASSSPGMVKFSGLGQANSKRPENSLVLGEVFTGIHPLSTDLRRLSWMTASYRELTFLLLSAFVQVLSLTIVRTTSSWSTTAPIDLIDNSVSIKTSIMFLIQKQCFTVTICLHAIEQGLKSYFLGDAIYGR
ncbi:LOW QUALITY PROTEIN: hypothetical protein Cgig2_003564 [Carnegiea gigantea]|uniref:Uncharacterized protein n=1 Tax=Carnegiea gigantea TaxID=171969 RepID=A0A9Q1JWU8_9CARY|nr:LOW QUALITY PROTEIN: hypothetical protein Cgig2_003564 [Carnegiea gigantea]